MTEKNYLNKISEKKIFFARIFLPLVLAASLSSCDCPEFNTQASIDPRVREVTITKFNAGWEGADTANTGRPVAEYSIHNFLFPSDQSSSGSLPNDNRVASNKVISVLSKMYLENNDAMTATLYVDKPTNPLLVGDILVDDVFIDQADYRNSRAYIRFAGSLEQFKSGSLPLTSSSAGAFADYLRSDPVKAEIESLGGRLKKYGQGLINAVSSNAAFRVRITDSGGGLVDDKNLPASNLRPIPPPNVLSAIDSAAAIASTTEAYATTIVEVRIGQVYYYRAKNGIDFGVFIENISEGNLNPKLRRVTIKFAELKGPSCQP